jgi:signal transduction histidine kinase/CheY-like chemotaxis protein
MGTKIKHFSRRRRKIIFAAAFVNIFTALIFSFVFYYIELHSLAYIVGFSSLIFLISAIACKKGHPSIARLIFILNFNISVALASSFIGKDGSIEFFLLFAIGLPFALFSIRRQKHLIFLFTLLPLTLLLALHLTHFNFFNVEQLDPLIAKTKVYPYSMTLTLLLIVFQLIYFSYMNASYSKNVHKKKQNALDASDAKSRFLSTMSHEIRTPLNAVIGLSHILGDNEPRKDQVENIEALNYSGKILLNLLNNVLDFSKMQSTNIELDNIPVDLSKAVNQIKKIHEASCLKKGIEMNLFIDENLPLVWLDIVRFNQVINNLVTNSIKFTEKGSVTLRIKKINQTDDELELLTEIIDTGIGIPKDKHEAIWEAFSQASSTTNRLYGGTGLGLPIVKSIIKSMGSDVLLESEIGNGSRFYFKLKLKLSSKEELIESNHIKDFNFEGKKVLLVEDNDINIMVAQQILEKVKLEVDLAYDGLQAVKKVTENKYDIVLMDIQMPIMDGYTASKEIRKFNTETPILALSASVFMEVKNRMEESGMNGFIFKPFDPQDLLHQIEEAIS